MSHPPNSSQRSTATALPPPHLSVQLHNPPSIHPPATTYTHIATIPISTTAKLITIAGQVGIDPHGNIAPDFASQIALALSNLGECLESVGCSKEELVKVTMYIVGRPGSTADEELRRSLYLGFLAGVQPPPDTVVYVAGLAVPELLFEVEVMAVGRLWIS